MNQPISMARYGLAYLLWAIVVALAFVALLVWRSTAFIILGMTPWDRYAEHAINQFGFLFIALAALCVIIFAEHFFRTGVEKGLIVKRFFLLALIEVTAITLAHLIQWIGSIVLQFPQSPVSPLVVMIEIVIAAGLFALYKSNKPKTATLAI